MGKALGFSLMVRIEKDTAFFGPGPRALLELVGGTGSLSAAAARMGMSYSKAQKIIKRMECETGTAFIERHAGGTGGGSSALTREGRAFLAAYAQFEEQLRAAGGPLFQACFSQFLSPDEARAARMLANARPGKDGGNG